MNDFLGVKAIGFVSSPKLLESRSGENVTDLIHITDWMPTFVSIAQGSVSNLSIDGLNQWNAIQSGDPSPREVSY